MRLASIATLALSILCDLTALADCGVERWPVKTGTDVNAAFIYTGAALPVSIEYLRSLPALRPLPQSVRVAPTETTVYDVTATLVDFKLEDDGDYHLVISDSAGRTIIAEIPSVNCDSGSAFASMITVARASFDSRFSASQSFQRVSVPVQIRGLGFFDFLHGQRGVAPNGIELHPVLSVSFSPLITPAPPLSARRRAVGGGRGSSCDAPTLTITTSKSSACGGEPITLTWQSSDPNATVSIDGVGTALPALGSTTVSTTASAAYSARATTTCGTSTEAVVVVNIQPGTSASLDASNTSLQQGATTALTATVADATSWNVASILGNALSPSAGTSTGAITIIYSALNAGNDTVTLTAMGLCGAVQRPTFLLVSAPQPVPQPQPQPQPGGNLRCCDGTTSPTCTSCANKQGCCSHHGGGCGCS